MLHAGGPQVRPGVPLVAPRVRVLLLQFDFQRRSLPRPSATSGTKDLPNLSGCFPASGAFVNKGRQIEAEPISDWRSLPNVASPPLPPHKSRGKMSFIGCVVPRNVVTSHACREPCSHRPISYRSAGQRALFSPRAFSWKTMLSLHSLTAPRGWCGGEGTCQAGHITCSS